MDKKYIIGIVCIFLIAIVGLGMALDGGDKTPEDKSTNYEGYQIKIIYDGEWTSVAGGIDSSNSYDGNGNKTIDLADVSGDIVSANAQKQDGSSSKLTIQILKDGKVIKEGSTTAAYGVAQITSS
ncbi:hypothetical protein [Methanobrevibacter curvatus]|uniref:Uncharacterized protein n=1 Tax=Methanobrevibacter curvatus TaxID=49547 RepID=A0A165ZGV0_9EURY|nr:hypothetical protein [Methanobrevibacter curvatus]KZX10698.1 hypothetical protein MBCUR_16910 [Methanobrevibacter curvatus]